MLTFGMYSCFSFYQQNYRGIPHDSKVILLGAPSHMRWSLQGMIASVAGHICRSYPNPSVIKITFP